jgi:hypothetical protein
MPPESNVPANDDELLDQDEESGVLHQDEEEESLHQGDEDDQDDKGKGDEEDEKDEEEKDKEDKEDEEKKDEDDVKFGERRPSFKEVKEKYPDLFKTFPSLRDAFFREGEYTKIFPTVDDAKEAQDELTTLQDLRDHVLEGDFGVILESARDADVRSFDKLVDNLLPALYKVDSDAFARAITPSIENLVRTAYREGLSKSDEDLQGAALQLSKWFFGSQDVARGTASGGNKGERTSPDKQNEREERLERDRKDFEVQRFRDAYNVVYSDCNDALRGEISDGIDPDNELSSYVKEKLVDDVVNAIDEELKKDPDHLALMNSKWRRAKQSGYDRESLRRIVNAYRARAKSLIVPVRSRLKSKALGPSAKKARNVDDMQSRKEMPAGGVHKGSNHNPSPRDIDWRSTSDADILAGNYKTRRS